MTDEIGKLRTTGRGGFEFWVAHWCCSFATNTITLQGFLSLSFPICQLSGQASFLLDLEFEELGFYMSPAHLHPHLGAAEAEEVGGLDPAYCWEPWAPVTSACPLC